MQKPHWHVLGAGAIGCLFAQGLHRSGSTTTLVMRRGVTVRSLPVVVEHDGQRCEQHLPVITPDDTAEISHLLITTKAYDVHSAVSGIAKLLSDNCVVLLLVNGLGLAEKLRADYPHLDVFCGTTTEGAYQLSAQHIQHAGRGETRVGRAGQDTPPAWFEGFARATDACVWDSDIDSALWSKLAVNCIINPLTAVSGCRNGELARSSELSAQVEALCSEVADISRAAGFDNIAEKLRPAVSAVIAGTADNRSSMLQDIERGRQTEIDYITGYLLKIAEQHGIQAPKNRSLLERIRNRAP
ncbi:2-dehydropantoate 2-reductase [Halioglobus japonicus]|nr:2-dehydropantoate 2-reductase [Halioglobus japonicus]